MKRRQFNQTLLASSAFPWMMKAQADVSNQTLKTIPSTGESIPAVGMGTWITFDHDPDAVDVTRLQQVLLTFFASGGQLIDSSPMYGFAQKLLGRLLPQVGDEKLFSATKVWVPGQSTGIKQMDTSMELWGLSKMDLIQVHNLMDWQAHLDTLKQWKSNGKIRYLGVTTSHGRRHSDLIHIMNNHPLDFVQFSYNIIDRAAEQRLLPLAADKGMAVIINRPFQTGGLFSRVRHKPLAKAAHDLACRSWAQLFLKFVISHPSVTCAIPATSNPDHMKENMAVLKQPLWSPEERAEAVKIFEKSL